MKARTIPRQPEILSNMQLLKKLTLPIAAIILLSTISSSFAVEKNAFPSEADPPAYNRFLQRNKKCVVPNTIQVLLTTNHTKEGKYLEGDPTIPGARHGSSVILSDPSNSGIQVGRYSVLTTFLRTTAPGLCVSSDAYAFFGSEDDAPPRDQLTFAATCENLPYFSITGGQGIFVGATGYVEYMIPHEEGTLHEIHVCKDCIGRGRGFRAKPSSTSPLNGHSVGIGQRLCILFAMFVFAQ